MYYIQSTRGLIAPGAEDHPLWTGIESGAIWGPTDVYGIRLPQQADCQAIVLGQVVNRAAEYDENDLLYGMVETDSEVATVNPAAGGDRKGQNPNDPMMPVAWTKNYQLPGGVGGKAFASTIGASTDFLNEATRRLFVNATYWLLDKEVPEKASVNIVGNYEPSPFAFRDDAYWDERNIVIKDLK